MASEAFLVPPAYCQYADGPCDQAFEKPSDRGPFFLYPSQPQQIAATIEAAVAKANATRRQFNWSTWRDLPIAGQIIFCEVCKGIRYSSTVVADVTTLNFNVLFEIGFALGLGMPVVPVRLGFRTSCGGGGRGCLHLEDFLQGGRDQATWLILGGK